MDSRLNPADDPDDVVRNRSLLIEHLSQLIDKVTSKEVIDKIPIAFKYVEYSLSSFYSLYRVSSIASSFFLLAAII